MIMHYPIIQIHLDPPRYSKVADRISFNLLYSFEAHRAAAIFASAGGCWSRIQLLRCVRRPDII